MKTTTRSHLPLSYLLLTSLIFLFATAAQAQVPSYVPTNGLVGYWPFNGNANDESGNGNNGTVNGATLAEDRFGSADKAYSFYGANDYIEISTNNGSFDSQTYTVSCWYKTNAVPYVGFYPRAIISRSNGSGSPSNVYDNFSIFEDGGTVSLNYHGVGTPLNSPSGGIDWLTQVNDDSWHLLNVTVNTDSLKAYVDGVLVNAQPFFAGISFQNYPLRFGKSNHSYWSEYNGILDDIGIWDRALTADEVLALYNGCNVVPQVVAGSSIASAFENSTYTCNNNAGSTYSWSATNGVVVSGQGTNSVSILWGAEGVGSVTVEETTADGCFGDPVSLDVDVQCVASGNAIEGFVVVVEYSNSIYTCNGAANSSYQWTVTNGIIESGQGTNSVTILWGSAGAGNIGVVETTYEGCVGATLSQDIVVAPGVNIEEFSTMISLFPNPATTELNLQTTSDVIGTDLFVFDALGKQILKQQILSTNTIINTSSFAAGNYVVKVGGGVKKFEVVR